MDRGRWSVISLWLLRGNLGGLYVSQGDRPDYLTGAHQGGLVGLFKGILGPQGDLNAWFR